MNRFILSVVFSLLSTTAYAQQFVAVKVEAENFSSKHSDWRKFTNSSTPNVNPDPDGSHASSASGKGYMELLPDTRVTHSDQLVTNGNFWNVAGVGPALSYNVNIPEAGRYIVFAKAYSTGTEDNGIHVGLNNQNPASGQRMQWCSGKNKWTWSSAQRTGSNHCGSPKTIYLDFSFAGANKVTFTAREDGFELDQFILLKTNSGSCEPNDQDQIVCNTGTTNITAQPSTVTPEVTPTPVVTPDPVAVPEPVVAPEPVVTPEPAETPTPVATPVQTVSMPAVSTDLLICTSTTADTDGDGYGWENNQSCLADGNTAAPAPTVISNTEFPTCVSASSDLDGDGYGWEQQQSCRVSNSSTATPAAPSGEILMCNSDASDTDGDGWGWENSQSCLVQQ